MKTEPRDVDREALARLVEEEHGLVISALSFLPEGDESFLFVAEDADGARHLVRLVEDVGQRNRLEDAYLAVKILAREELPALVAPRRTRQGGFLGAYGPYLMSLFPFINGRTLFGTATREDRGRVAEIVAALHETEASHLRLPRAGLENPFEGPIRRALADVESPRPNVNLYQDRVSTLLTANREDVASSMRRMEDFLRQEDVLVGEWVLTHGEPHLANVLRDSQGRLHLTDCGDLAVGPPERDLFAFAGPYFEGYLRPYLRRRGTVNLSPPLFEFYFYRWALQEIADYTNRILFRDMGPEEDEHSWRELQQYLPTRHNEIARAMRRVRGVLANFSS